MLLILQLLLLLFWHMQPWGGCGKANNEEVKPISRSHKSYYFIVTYICAAQRSENATPQERWACEATVLSTEPPFQVRGEVLRSLPLQKPEYTHDITVAFEMGTFVVYCYVNYSVTRFLNVMNGRIFSTVDCMKLYGVPPPTSCILQKRVISLWQGSLAFPPPAHLPAAVEEVFRAVS